MIYSTALSEWQPQFWKFFTINFFDLWKNTKETWVDIIVAFNYYIIWWKKYDDDDVFHFSCLDFETVIKHPFGNSIRDMKI